MTAIADVVHWLFALHLYGRWARNRPPTAQLPYKCGQCKRGQYKLGRYKRERGRGARARR